MLLYAHHKITTGVTAEKTNKTHEPGSLFEIDEPHATELQAIGAAREPTEAEIAVHEKIKAAAPAPAADAAPPAKPNAPVKPPKDDVVG